MATLFGVFRARALSALKFQRGCGMLNASVWCKANILQGSLCVQCGWRVACTYENPVCVM